MTVSPSPILQLGPAAAGLAMHGAEFDAAEFEPGWRYELIHGLLVVNPAPLPQERGLNERLGNLLWAYQQTHPFGSRLDDTLPGHDIHVADQRRRADRVIWAGLGRQPQPDETPAIVVECVSAGKRNQIRDYEDKRREYEQLGVQEYWVLNRFARTMTLFCADKEPQVLGEDETFTTQLLPEFELKLAALFAVADRWDA